MTTLTDMPTQTDEIPYGPTLDEELQAINAC